MMNKEIQQLATSMPVAIRNLMDFVARAMDEKELGLTTAQLCLLELLSGSEDPCQSAIAQQMGIDKSAILRQVDILEVKGWVERRVDPKDRRRKHLVLSRSGKAKLTKAMRKRDAQFAKAATGIPRKDIETCTKVLCRLGNYANKAVTKMK